MVNSMIIQDGVIAWFDGPEWDEVAREALEEAKDRVIQAARDNAPWEDQTGDARAGLDAQITSDDGMVTLYLFHTVDYGLWLEVIQNGKFATILPTLESNAPWIFREAEQKIAIARQGENF